MSVREVYVGCLYLETGFVIEEKRFAKIENEFLHFVKAHILGKWGDMTRECLDAARKFIESKIAAKIIGDGLMGDVTLKEIGRSLYEEYAPQIKRPTW